MSKTYLMKFKEDIDEIKKEAILEGKQVVKFVELFGIYVLHLADDIADSLQENENILYLKEGS